LVKVDKSQWLLSITSHLQKKWTKLVFTFLKKITETDFIRSFEVETKLKMPSGDLAIFKKNVHNYLLDQKPHSEIYSENALKIRRNLPVNLLSNCQINLGDFVIFLWRSFNIVQSL
jgi:hypothetical protein